MPNHLRPSRSYKGLTKGMMESPRTFKDRIYLTDVVDSLWQVVSTGYPGMSVEILWRKRYFPWRIKIQRDCGGHILLEGRLIGDTTWASVVEMRFNGLEAGGGMRIDDVLEAFVQRLGRPPYETPYWTDEIWSRFLGQKQLARQTVEAAWASNFSQRSNLGKNI